LCAAQSAVLAYELSVKDASDRDAELLAIALRRAQVIEANLPPKTGRRWKAELGRAMPNVKNTGGVFF
jgi:hypothetical protein